MPISQMRTLRLCEGNRVPQSHIVGKVKVKVAQSCLTLRPRGLYSPWNSSGQNTGVGSGSLLQENFPTQGSNPGIEPRSHSFWADSLLAEPQGKPPLASEPSPIYVCL